MNKKKIFTKKTSLSPHNNTTKKTAAKTIQKPVIKSTLNSQPKLSSNNKRKSVSPKKVVRKEISSDSSSSSSSESESECEMPVKRKSRIVVTKKRMVAKDSESSSDDSDLSDESDSKNGKIIRIPVDREEQHKYYK